ncbi:TonB family protein [Maribacter sp. 2307ULW6-5]|uniref:TonB family protein n=1 Tax=Maribacter sp. 2307ULW6-5 TaxID=3386275 RepID=UPI0039BC2743
MVQYILECMAFQLAFLVIYDFFLKKETFFQWNRAYLLGTYVLSLVLPWIKIEALKTSVPEQYVVYPEFLWNMDHVGATVAGQAGPGFQISWQEGVLYLGMLLATVYFGYKLVQLYRLGKNGHVERFPNFTRIVVANSEMAFSFFRSIFLGDKILQRKHANIIKHELVHIQQRHTLDLLFFELMRIVGWFNPLVYVYQNRIAELHEFIADAQVPKAERRAHYDLLLSRAFQTQHISFVNQLYKKSLIKKRIVMLQKSKSKKVHQLKYLLLLPLVLGMLAYTSADTEEKEMPQEQTSSDAELIAQINQEIEDEIKEKGDLDHVYLDFDKKLTESEGEVISKYRFFKAAILREMWLEKFMDSPGKVAKMSIFKPNGISTHSGTSTPSYERYVQRAEAFQFLDQNVEFSLGNGFQNAGTRIKLLKNKNTFPQGSLVFKVGDAKDLTGAEIRSFNQHLAAIFENGTSPHSGLILTDGSHAFEVFVSDAGTKSRLTAPEEQSPSDSIPFGAVDKVPVFPGCEGAGDQRACFQKMMQRHIAQHFRYPPRAQKLGIQGLVGITLTIGKDGALSAVGLKGPDPLLEAEAKRIMDLLPQMEPGRHKGKQVAVLYSMPLTFKLQNAGAGNERDALAENVPFAVAEQVPIFPGCEDAADKRACFGKMVQKHIAEHFRYPKEAEQQSIQGMVSLLFTIAKNGKITDIKSRAPHWLLQAEAERIIRELPQMTPGRDKGKKVKVPYAIPIYFKLKPSDTLATKNGDRGGYGTLLEERERLLKTMDENNPALKSVDARIERMEDSILTSIKNKEQLAIITADGTKTKGPVVTAATYQDGKKRFLAGKVTDGKKALPGVNVGTRDKGFEKVTDAQGKFRLEVRTGDVLVFDHTDWEPVGFEIKDKTNYRPTKDDLAQILGDDAGPLVFLNGVESSMDLLKTLDPSTMKRINVLKRDAAIKLYGERGQNGVIEVIAKKKK